MSARLLKQPGNGARFTLKMPINAASRAAVDAENERVRGSVIPIIRDKNGRPYLEGSAVALANYFNTTLQRHAMNVALI